MGHFCVNPKRRKTEAGRAGQIDVDARSKCSSQPIIIAVHDAGGGGVSRNSAWVTSTIVLRFEQGRDRSGHLISDAYGIENVKQ